MKHVPEDFIVDSLEELNMLIDEQNFIFAKAIVEGILKNLDTDISEVFLMSITVKAEKATYDITVKREDFAETLEEPRVTAPLGCTYTPRRAEPGSGRRRRADGPSR